MAATVDYVTHSASEARPLLDDLAVVYADAYGVVPGEDSTVKTSAFRHRATRAFSAPNYALVTAHADEQLVGFVFGYSLRPESSWWEGLEPASPAGWTDETGHRTAVVAEIEVREAWQGQGIGRQLHDRFLSGRTEERATLATGPKAEAARRRYEGWGWQKAGTAPGASGDYFDAYTLYVLRLPLNVSTVRSAGWTRSGAVPTE